MWSQAVACQDVPGQALGPWAKPRHEPGSAAMTAPGVAAAAAQGIRQVQDVVQGGENSPFPELGPGVQGGSGWTVVGPGCQDPACPPQGAAPI